MHLIGTFSERVTYASWWFAKSIVSIKKNVDEKDLSSKTCCTVVTADVWHLGLGHIPFNKLKLALHQNCSALS